MGLYPFSVSHFSSVLSLKVSMKNFHIIAKDNRFESHLTPFTFSLHSLKLSIQSFRHTRIVHGGIPCR